MPKFHQNILQDTPNYTILKISGEHALEIHHLNIDVILNTLQGYNSVK